MPVQLQVKSLCTVPWSLHVLEFECSVHVGPMPSAGPKHVQLPSGCATPRPTASNLNFTPGQAIPNAVITPVSPTGDICVYAYGTADIIIDINGYFPR